QLAEPNGGASATSSTASSHGTETGPKAASATTNTFGTVNALGKFVTPFDLATSSVWDAGGLVGINTSTPFDALHVAFTDFSGAFTGYAVQNRGGGAGSYSGMLFYDQNGVLGQFQGFNNATHEYRINNVAFGGSINFMIGSNSKFRIANNGDVSIAGPLLKNGTRFLHGAGASTFGGLFSGSFVQTGDFNTGFGYAALTANTAGFSNAAFGGLALSSNTTGVDNTAIGEDTLRNNTGGSSNTAAGSFALDLNAVGSDNTAVGVSALEKVTSSENVGIGAFALRNTSTGFGNAALGEETLYNNSTGSSNTALGLFAGINATTGSNNIYVGANVYGVAGESDTMRLGNQDAGFGVSPVARTFMAGG